MKNIKIMKNIKRIKKIKKKILNMVESGRTKIMKNLTERIIMKINLLKPKNQKNNKSNNKNKSQNNRKNKSLNKRKNHLIYVKIE